MVVAYVGLGSNLDGPGEQVERALRELDALPRTRLLAHSSSYRTPPWSGIAQPDFVNAVARVRTGLGAHELMRALLALEHRAGRRRDGERNGPRVLDLDLLLYGEETLADPDLTLPHPRLHERAFALAPLAELAPDLIVPGHGPVRDLLAGVDVTGVMPI